METTSITTVSTLIPDPEALGGGSSPTTPPVPSHVEEGQSSGKKYTNTETATDPMLTSDADTQTDISLLFAFSAKTCLELLPQLSKNQRDFEFAYHQVLNPDYDEAETIRTRNPGEHVKVSELSRLISKQLCTDIQTLTFDYDSLLIDFSRELKEAREHCSELRRSTGVPLLPSPIDTADLFSNMTDTCCGMEQLQGKAEGATLKLNIESLAVKTHSQERTSIPPIAPPYSAPKAAEDVSGILLLTDSMIGSAPLHVFNCLPDHTFVKKANYELKDMFNYEPEFKFYDYVVLSMGINDLSRYGLSAHSLADLVLKKLGVCCQKHPNTTFIFNSLLLTAHEWLNKEVELFNSFMFELSLAMGNLWFCDSHEALKGAVDQHALDNVLDGSERGNGIHLTFEARKLVTRQLVNCVVCRVHETGSRTAAYRLRGWKWPLRDSFNRMYRATVGTGHG